MESAFQSTDPSHPRAALVSTTEPHKTYREALERPQKCHRTLAQTFKMIASLLYNERGQLKACDPLTDFPYTLDCEFESAHRITFNDVEPCRNHKKTR